MHHETLGSDWESTYSHGFLPLVKVPFKGIYRDSIRV